MTSNRRPLAERPFEGRALHGAFLAVAVAALAGLAAFMIVGAGASASRDLTVTLAAPSNATDNATFAVNMTAFNAGTGAGSTVQIQLFVDGNATATLHDLGNLANGENASALENLTLPCGVYALNATVDPSDGIPETNESNNNASAMLLVLPFVDFSSSIAGDPGSITLSLNGSASHGCAPLLYNWVIDGLPRTGATVTFTPNAGDINVTLTVVSQGNPVLLNSLTRTLTIPNGAPNVTATVPAPTIATLTPLALAVTADDSDGSVASYFIDFGDGNSTTDFAAAIDYRYHQSGNFTVLVRVTDNLGATNETNVSVRVTNRAPEVGTSFPYWETAAGTAVEFNASSSTDPEGGPLTYSWDFGDGTSATGAVANHTYATPGSYVATLTVTDSSGASANTTMQVRVDPGPSSGGSLLPIIGGVLLLLVLAALLWLLLARRRRDGEEEERAQGKQGAEGTSTGAPAKPGEGSSPKPPSP